MKIDTSPFKILEFSPNWNLEIFVYTFLVVPSLIILFLYHWNRRHLYKYASKVQGPKSYPLIGRLLDFTGSADAIYGNVMKLFDSYPDLYKVWYGQQLVFGVSKPEYLETVLTSPKALSKMYLYKFATAVVGQGLFTAPIPVWKRHRKIIMPAFNQKILEGFVEVYEKQSTIMCKQLEKYLGKREFDVIHPVSKCALDIVCETTMGIKVNAQTDDSLFGQWLERVLEIVFLRMFVVWYHFDFVFRWTKLYREECQLIKNFHNFTSEVIKEKRQKHRADSTKRKAFLDLLLDNNNLSETELRDEVNVLMIAASDTTANSFSFVLLMLAMHPHVQENVFQETISVLGSDGVVEAQDLPLFQYTERVIKETLRLFPVGAFIVRDIDDDLPLGDGVVFPKGSSAILGIMRVHRNGDIWPNPLKFDPDRFLAEKISERHAFSYLPFSGGPRNCIGPKYGMMALKTMVSSVVRKFKFYTSYKNVEDVKLKTNIMLRPQEGYKISLEMRK